MKEYKVLYLDIDDPIEDDLNRCAEDRWELTKIIPAAAVGYRSVFIMKRNVILPDTVYSRDDNEPIPGEKRMRD